MEAKYTQYDYKKSIVRIDEILNSSDFEYSEHSGIPARERLTFTNGFYVDVTVLFIDIRGSKILSEKHTKPVLAKIYRAYISEVVAVLNGNEKIHEIYIEGDGIWAVFNTINSADVDSVFNTAYTISSLIDVFNVKLTKKKYSAITVGIGIEDGESLYIKAGYKGVSINEVVWIGKTVGQAAKLCSNGNRTTLDYEIMVSKKVYSCLSKHNQGLMSFNYIHDCYHGNVVHSDIDLWVKANG